MKIKVLLFAFFMSFALSLPALAEVKDFGKFKVDVPAGWTAKDDDGTVIIAAADNSAVITITAGDNDGTSIEELAKQVSAELKGSAPKLEDDTYIFTFKNENGVDSHGFVSGDAKQFALVTITGEHSDTEKILNSLEEN